MKKYLIKFLTVVVVSYSHQAYPSVEKKTTLEPCSLELAPKILFFKKAKNLNQTSKVVKKKSFCSEDQLAVILDVLWRLEGKITSQQLKRLLNEEGSSFDMSLEPEIIDIFHIENLAKERISLKENLRLSEINIIGTVYAISVNNLSGLGMECHGCHSVGSKNFSIVYHDSSKQGYHKKLWATAKILEVKNVVVAEKDIGPFVQDDIQNYVKLVPKALEKSRHRYLSTLSHLEYFNVNKYIKKGDLLKRSDLTPKKIVKAGKPTKVIVSQGGFKVQTEAIAKQSGKYGEFINLYNPKSRKKIRARVIGFNKVKVDL